MFPEGTEVILTAELTLLWSMYSWQPVTKPAYENIKVGTAVHNFVSEWITRIYYMSQPLNCRLHVPAKTHQSVEICYIFSIWEKLANRFFVKCRYCFPANPLINLPFHRNQYHSFMTTEDLVWNVKSFYAIVSSLSFWTCSHWHEVYSRPLLYYATAFHSSHGQGRLRSVIFHKQKFLRPFSIYYAETGDNRRT